MILAYSVLPTMLALWALFHIAYSGKTSKNEGWLWRAIVVTFPATESIHYFHTRKKKRFDPPFKNLSHRPGIKDGNEK